jgi:hypothetical protein
MAFATTRLIGAFLFGVAPTDLAYGLVYRQPSAGATCVRTDAITPILTKRLEHLHMDRLAAMRQNNLYMIHQNELDLLVQRTGAHPLHTERCDNTGGLASVIGWPVIARDVQVFVTLDGAAWSFYAP